MGETGLFTSGFTVTGVRMVSYGALVGHQRETAYYFGDIGSATIGESGEVVISIDEIFQECVNTTIPYHVFTQVYCGSISNIDRQVGHFTVKGALGTEFSWELKAKRRGYESDRLETFDPGEHVEGSIIEMELNSIPNLEKYFINGGYEKVTGIVILTTAEGERITYTYSEINETTGQSYSE